MERINHFLFNSAPALNLNIFRIFFGLCLIYEGYLKWSKDIYFDYFDQADFLFGYFDQFPILPASYIPILFLCLMIFAIPITLGIYTRMFSFLYLVFYSYFFLLDRIFYNNHYYLIILLCIIFSVIKSDGQYSITAKMNGAEPDIPKWQILLLKFQIGIPYLFSGIAKINSYWLSGQPSIYLWENNARPWLVLTDPNTIKLVSYFYQYSGLLFDLSIFFLLIGKRTWKLGITGAFLFHSFNFFTLKIGSFPLLMIASLILFIPYQTMAKWFKRNKFDYNNSIYKSRTIVKLGLAFYIMIQLALPIRHFAYEGFVDWTGEGRDFAWRMKQVTKVIDEFELRFKCDLGVEYFNDYINDEIYMMSYKSKIIYDPLMLIDFCDYIQKRHFEKSGGDIEIYCNLRVSMNGNNPQYLIYPHIDLTTISANKNIKWLKLNE